MRAEGLAGHNQLLPPVARHPSDGFAYRRDECAADHSCATGCFLGRCYGACTRLQLLPLSGPWSAAGPTAVVGSSSGKGSGGLNTSHMWLYVLSCLLYLAEHAFDMMGGWLFLYSSANAGDWQPLIL